MRLEQAPPQLVLPVHLLLPRLNGHTHITTPPLMMSLIPRQISAFRHICRLHRPLRFPLMRKPLWKMSDRKTLSNTPLLPQTLSISSNLTADSYAALAALPLSYPWSSLVLDLKDLLPILDRYVLTCLLASSAAAGEDLQHDQALFPLLKTLAQTIDNIISPQASLNTRPVLPKDIKWNSGTRT